MRRLILCLVTAVAVLFGAVSVGVASEAPVLDRIIKSGQLRVGMSGNQPPLNMVNKDGDLMGMEVDLARLLAKSLGVEAKLVTKPFGDLLGALDAGEVDMVMSGMTITLERNMRAAFVGPYMISGKSILTKSSTLAAAQEAEDLDMANVRLVALAGSTSQKFVEALMPKAKLTATSDYDAAVKMVVEGQADAMVADMPICVLSVLRYPKAELTTLTKPLTLEPIGIALPPGDSLLINLVENYLRALEMTGLLEELTKAWFEDGSWLIQLP